MENGMSKHIALEAQQIIPDFNGNCPLAFYSNTPSFVAQHRTALEALSAGIAAMLAAVCAALAVLLAKAIKYFFGSSSGGGGGGGSAALFADKHEFAGKQDTFVKTLHAREEAINQHFKQTFDMIDEIHARQEAESAERREERRQIPQSRGLTFSDLDSMFAVAIQEKGEDAFIGRMLYADDPMTLDLIQQGPYCMTMSSAAQRTGPKLKHWIEQLEKAIVTLTKDYPEVMNDDKSIFLRHGILVNAEEIQHLLKVETIDHDGVATVNKRIEEARIKMNEGVTPHRFKYSELHRKIEQGVSKLPLDKMREIYDSCEALLPELQAKLEKLSQGLGAFENKEMVQYQREYQQHVTHFVKGLRHEVQEVIKFMSDFDRFGKQLRQIETRMFKLQTEAVKLISEHAKKYGAHNVDMEKLEKELRDKLAATK